jgi:acyl-CoA synthetase (AMP-forming)/AMP-acid ligase II
MLLMTSYSAHDPGFDFSPTTLVDMLRQRAEGNPDQIVFIFLNDGESEEDPITYRQLDLAARRIAARLQAMGVEGERALLLYPPGLEYIRAFFGCLYAGVIAVPAYPPRLNRPAPRIQAIVADAESTIALATTDILDSMEKRFEHAPDLKLIKWVDTGKLPESLAEDWQEQKIVPDHIAFLQYTSGSTSTPKGVILSHANLVHNLEQIRHGFQLISSYKCVSWLPSYHDMGLIGGLMGTIYSDLTTILLSPLAFLQRPLRWLRAISHYRASISGAPNFAYDLCVEKINQEQREELDLSCWEIAFSGAEPVRVETMQRFAKAFALSGFRYNAFYPCYGLAEATLYVTGGDPKAEPTTLTVKRSQLEQDRIEPILDDQEGAQILVGCGSKKLDQEIAIVDPETFSRCDPQQVGEIWISGDSVAQGYWRRPEENQKMFGARIAGEGEKTYLRTGDLGFLDQDELYITGRLKDLIIIRGSNHYPQDIELTVERCHEALQSAGAGAFSIDVDNEERLVVVHEVDRRHRRDDLNPVIQAIRKAIAENHDLQVYAIVLIMPFTIPKTSSGKIKRHACKEKYLSGSFDVLAEWAANR